MQIDPRNHRNIETGATLMAKQEIHLWFFTHSCKKSMNFGLFGAFWTRPF